MRYSYKTALSFGLVFVPVTLHACIRNNDIAFNTLYKKTGERIKYHKTCENCPANLKNTDIIKGYQYEKDKYITLSDEELEKIKTKKDKVIEIESFVNVSEIDPIYYDKSYYVNPSSAQNAFALIIEALQSQKKVGIAKTVLGTKEQVVAIRVINGQMILNTMHFYDEVEASPVKKMEDKVNAKELSLAKLIVNNMTESFQPQKYKNEYREKVLKAVEGKIKGQTIKGEKISHTPTTVINLMDALQKSLKSNPKKSNTRATKAKIIPFKKNA